MSLLFVGLRREAPLASAIEAAVQLGLEHEVLDEDELHHYEIDIGLHRRRWRAVWWTGRREVDLTSFHGVYTRAVPARLLPQSVRFAQAGRSDPLLPLRQEYFIDGLNAWLDMTPQRVANRNAAAATNASKPWQMQWIRECGFAVPETLVSNDAALVRRFVETHRRVIYKSSSGVRSVVTELKPGDLARLHRVARLPTLFQAFVPGVDYRVHVVGRRVFCTRIDSSAVDYRYAAREGCEATMHADRLPADVAGRCVRLAARLGLEFAGIDLKRTPDGRWVCFEANPSPAYSCFDDATGAAVACSLVQHLNGGPDGSSHRERGVPGRAAAVPGARRRVATGHAHPA